MKSNSSPPSPLPPVSSEVSLEASPDRRARQTRSSRGADIIKQRIKRGIYRPGQQLPSLRTLSNELNLSLPAMQRAIRQLEYEAILESKHGVGTRILEGAHCGTTPLFFGFVQPYFSRFSDSLQHYLEEALDTRSNLCFFKSSHGSPERERSEIERLVDSGVNGLLVWPVESNANSAFLQEVSKRLPLVLVDRTVAEVKTPAVVLDYESAGRAIVQHLHNENHRRILVVCDPTDISSYHMLKFGLREAAKTLGGNEKLYILDNPVVPLIEAAYRNDYSLADACYERLIPLLCSGDYDALFCPQSEFFDQVFADAGRAAAVAHLHCVTLRTPNGPPHSRRYHEMPIEEWILDTPKMIVQALDLLQDITLNQKTGKRAIKIPIERKQNATESAIPDRQ